MMEGALKKAAKQNVDGCHLIMDHEDLDRNSGAAMTMHAIFSSLPSRWGIEVFTLHPLFFQASERASEREREREGEGEGGSEPREHVEIGTLYTEYYRVLVFHLLAQWLCMALHLLCSRSPYVPLCGCPVFVARRLD